MNRGLPILLTIAVVTSAPATGLHAQEALPPVLGGAVVFDPSDPLAPANAPDPLAVAAPPAVADPAEPLALRPTLGPALAVGVSARPASPAQARAAPVQVAPPPAPDREEADRAAFEPAGIRAGGFRLDASVSTGVEASSTDGASILAAGRLAVASEWERHAAGFTLRGSRDTPVDGETADPSLEAALDGRLDFTEVDSLAGRLAWAFGREDADSTEVVASGSRSDVHTLAVALDYRRRAGLIGLDASAAVERTLYSDASDRDDTLVSGALRLTLDSGAMLQPFVEAGAFARLPDEAADGAGFRRRGLGGELKGGFGVDAGLVSGEVAAGWAVEHLDDERLETVSAAVFEAALGWTPAPLLRIDLVAATSLEPTSIAGASGSVTRALDVSASYALQPNLTVSAGGGISVRDYVGVDLEELVLGVRAGAGWRLSPVLELTLEAGHTITDRSGPGTVDDEETVVGAGLTISR